MFQTVWKYAKDSQAELTCNNYEKSGNVPKFQDNILSTQYLMQSSNSLQRIGLSDLRD